MSRSVGIPENENPSQIHHVSVTSTPTVDGDSGRSPRQLNTSNMSGITENSVKSKHQTTKERAVVKRWTKQGRLISMADDSVFFSGQQEKIMLTARGLCRDYICYRLKRSGFRGRVVITKYAPAKDQKLSFDILQIGKTFEEFYPNLFRNLTRNLGYVLRSPEELQVLFQRLGSEVMGPNPEEYRWGRILALLAVAGTLAVDCIAQGHVELIEDLVTIFCDFIEVNLVSWIIDHGGWENMGKIFSIEKELPRSGFIFACRGSNLLAVAISGVIMSGIIFTMGVLSRQFSLWEGSFLI